MKYTIDTLQEQAKMTLAATGLVAADAVKLNDPKPNIPADLAFPTFQAARDSATPNPAAFAQKLAAAVAPDAGSLVGKVEAAGPFVNISVAPDRFAHAVITEILAQADNYGRDDIGAGQKLVVEFSSPNIARKMHIGHLRSTIIGNAIRNIMQRLGYEVIADNHLGDWGTQFGSLLAAYTLYGLPDGFDDPIDAMVQLYADFHKKSEADLTLRDLARDWFKRLEDGDPQAREIWNWMIDLTLQEFARTYARLGVTFDTQHGESFYEPMLAGVVKEALDTGVAQVEEGGAVSVTFPDTLKLPSYLLRKSDGATLYQTRDVATCIWRWNTYQPNRNIYIVGAEQKLHFQQVYATTRLLGYSDIADRSVHIPFGAVKDEEGNRFSMRKGTAIFLNDVLDEALARSRTIISQKLADGKTDLTDAEQERISQIIGIGAIIYNDLYQDPNRQIRFDWDTMLSFDGNSAPYIQYMHARVRSIIRKAGDLPDLATTDFGGLILPEEQAVIKWLARFPQVVRRAGTEFSPSLIADWTYNVAREFSRFYNVAQVLEAETPELRAARLGLVAAVAQGLRNGLSILGITAPERM